MAINPKTFERYHIESGVSISGLYSKLTNLGLLGFAQDELAKLLGGDLQEGLCDPDEVPEPPDEAITQPGD